MSEKNLNQRINNAFVEIESRIQRNDGSGLVILHRLVNKELEQRKQTILDLAEALNRAANDMGKRGCGLYSKELVNEYRTLAAQHIKNPIGE